MRIAVNVRLMIQGKLEGIGNFIYETFTRIVEDHPEHEFIFIVDRKIDERWIRFDNLRFEVLNPPARHPFLFYIWFHIALPRLLRSLKPDLFISTDGFTPLKREYPTLNVVHDLNFYHRPQDLPRLYSWYYNRYFPFYARLASRIATVSEYSKQDIMLSYGIEGEKIDVVYNGVHGAFLRMTEDEQQHVREQYSKGQRFFVYVGSMHARKNIGGLLQAFELFREKSGEQVKLVMVGRKMFDDGKIEQQLRVMRHQEDIIFTGRLDNCELARVLGSAEAMVFVPFFEGFGIPLIEAFRSGTPVLCSGVTSLPEVAGGAALYVDPQDVEGIAAAMERILNEEELRDELIQKGQERVQLFSWEKTAAKLWQSVERTLEKRL